MKSKPAPLAPESVLPGSNPTLFNWLGERGSGILLHPTSFPSDQGIGTFDGEAERFLDFLQAAGCQYWQLCPLGPTGYGDSPYQCFSAFAGNPYLINLHELVDHGLLAAEDLRPLAQLDHERVDFGNLYQLKWPLLFRAYENYRQAKGPAIYGDFAAFKQRQASWLEGYAYYRAVKDKFGGRPWWDWPNGVRSFVDAQHSPLRTELANVAEAHMFTQYVFFGQWARVRASAAQRGISIVGDIPIFVAADSADAWANPQLFELDESTSFPLALAGVPPDYFSDDGQLWGNPLYRWDRHATDNYAWWRERMRSSFDLYDVVRIDHFRGFDEYWRVPFPAINARVGEWMPGPGIALFKSIQEAFPQAKIIAEDLGVITPSVAALRDATGLPGMAVLQFGFGGKADNLHLPHNVVPNSVIYSGTHDNDTSLGWYTGALEKDRDHARRYLRVEGREMGWDLIRAGYSSVSRLAVFPLQDVLSLGSEARFNSPGKARGNWQWRYRPDQREGLLNQGTAAYLRSLGDMYGRLKVEPTPAA